MCSWIDPVSVKEGTKLRLAKGHKMILLTLNNEITVTLVLLLPVHHHHQVPQSAEISSSPFTFLAATVSCERSTQEDFFTPLLPPPPSHVLFFASTKRFFWAALYYFRLVVNRKHLQCTEFPLAGSINYCFFDGLLQSLRIITAKSSLFLTFAQYLCLLRGTVSNLEDYHRWVIQFISCPHRMEQVHVIPVISTGFNARWAQSWGNVLELVGLLLLILL